MPLFRTTVLVALAAMNSAVIAGTYEIIDYRYTEEVTRFVIDSATSSASYDPDAGGFSFDVIGPDGGSLDPSTPPSHFAINGSFDIVAASHTWYYQFSGIPGSEPLTRTDTGYYLTNADIHLDGSTPLPEGIELKLPRSLIVDGILSDGSLNLSHSTGPCDIFNPVPPGQTYSCTGFSTGEPMDTFSATLSDDVFTMVGENPLGYFAADGTLAYSLAATPVPLPPAFLLLGSVIGLGAMRLRR